MQPKDQSDTLALSHDLRRHIAQGLLYTTGSMPIRAARWRAMSFLYALIELLEEKDSSPLRNWTAGNGSWGSGWWITAPEQQQRDVAGGVR